MSWILVLVLLSGSTVEVPTVGTMNECVMKGERSLEIWRARGIPVVGYRCKARFDI